MKTLPTFLPADRFRSVLHTTPEQVDAELADLEASLAVVADRWYHVPVGVNSAPLETARRADEARNAQCVAIRARMNLLAAFRAQRFGEAA